MSPTRSHVVNKALHSSTLLNESTMSIARDNGNGSRNQLDEKVAQKKEPFNAKEFLMPGLTEKDVEQLKEVFDSYDLDGNGLITPMELRNALLNYGFNASKETTYNIIAEYDEEERGGLIFTEFLRLMVRGPPSNYETKEDIERIFRMFDRGKKGYIDINDLRNAAKELKEDIDEETLSQVVHKADANMDKKISFTDFYNVMVRKIDA